MKNFFISAVLFAMGITAPLYSQEKCRTVELHQERIANDPSIQAEIDDINDYTENWIATEYEKFQERKAVITLPVVVHVLWNDSSENISDAQIQSQIDVLNDDFRKTNSNFSNTPPAFQSIAADTEIQFCLAGIDPQGNPTNGITRTYTDSTDHINNYFSTADGGKDPWNPESYINIWVCDLGPVILGFAILPAGPFSFSGDGLVISSDVFGTVGTAANSIPNHLGRTATHEMGHYLNLHHLWGEQSGGCSDDDFVSDTPLQAAETFDCPTFPLTDGCTSTGSGINFQNYMDYTNDDCMTMFTEGQKARMLATLNGPRSYLLSSNACGSSNAELPQLEKNMDFSIYPNPAQNEFTITLSNKSIPEPILLELHDVTGKVLSNYLVQNETTISTTQLPNGIYMLVSPNSPSFSKKIIIQK